MAESSTNYVIVYSDVNPDVTEDGPYEIVTNADAIIKSLETCFLTPKYSRPFRRIFGSKLQQLLFDPMDDITASAIGYELKQVAEDWEDRITSVSVTVIPNYEKQVYFVSISFIIPKLGDKFVTYTFNLKKTT